MKNIVILGAGTGGTLISNLLTQHLDLTEWAITVIDRSKQHVYQPGLLFIPFNLYGYDSGEDLVKEITEPLPRNVKFVGANVTLIDHENKRVQTDGGEFPYDFLVSAMGCRIDPEGVEGLQAAMEAGVAHTFYTLEGANKLRPALEKMESGKLVLDICDMPIKCPVAPIEFVFLADYYFHLKGIRDRVEITLVTPYAGAFTKPNANRVLTEIAEKKGIKVVPDFAISSVNMDQKSITSFDGRTVGYDLLVTIPGNVGPEVLDESGLGDGNGYGLTDPRTLKSKVAEGIYFLGDNTNVATSKAGSVAHFEAETVVENILREIEGKPPLGSYDGHSNCYIESGYHKALLIDFNYDMEPLEGSFPLPYAGPFSLLKETYMNHMGKIAFKWIYWNMLLPGRLGSVLAAALAHEFPRQGSEDHAADSARQGDAREGRDDQGRADGESRLLPRRCGQGLDPEARQRDAGAECGRAACRHPHRGRFCLRHGHRRRRGRRRAGIRGAQAPGSQAYGHHRG